MSSTVVSKQCYLSSKEHYISERQSESTTMKKKKKKIAQNIYCTPFHLSAPVKNKGHRGQGITTGFSLVQAFLEYEILCHDKASCKSEPFHGELGSKAVSKASIRQRLGGKGSLKVRSSVVAFSSHPWRPGWAAAWHGSGGEGPRFPAPSQSRGWTCADPAPQS